MSTAATAGAPPVETNWGKLFLGFGGMVIGQFMAILDIQIVASSLTQIQAGVGATADEISWVQTIYLLAEVVIIPLTAYMTRLWGTQRTFIACCSGFIVSSVAVGLATDIEAMIVLRAVQGLAAGAMIPPVFAIAFTAFPPERRITANVIVGLIVTLAPTIGPTLGGHITEALGWRWLFFINVPPGLLAIFLVSRWGAFDKGDPALAKGVDWIGVATLAISLLSIQYVLEEGADERWFQDGLILWLAVAGVIAGAVFIWRQLSYRQPLLNLTPFRNGNFTLGIIMTFLSGIGLFGGTFLLPLFLGQVRHYSAGEVGTTMLVSGLAMFITGPIAGRLVRQLDPRLPLFIGFGLAAYGIGLAARVTEQWGFWEFAWMQTLRGVGTMIAMIASQTLTVSTLSPGMMKDASALVNLTRNVGGAVGLAGITTILGHMTAVHYGELTSAIGIGDPIASQMLGGFSQMMTAPGVIDPEAAGRKAFAGHLHLKALTLAFGDAFFWLAASCALAAVLGLFGKPGKATAFNSQEVH